jgi:hypothetical protein
MALDNCTIDQKQVVETAGSNLATDTVVLTITPDSGYTVTAANFTNNTGVLAGILSIVLTDSGTPGTAANTVLVTVDLDNAIYTMPAADTELVIDIDGAADAVLYSIAGTYDITETNTDLSDVTGVVYSGNGIVGATVSLFTTAFTPDSGFIFESASDIQYTINTSLPSNYSVVVSSTVDGDGDINFYSLEFKYTFTSQNVTGDKIEIFAEAKEKISPPGVEITSYSIDTGFVPPAGATRVLTLYGSIGANYTIDVVDIATSSIYSSSGSLASTEENFIIVFPFSSTNDTYTITIGGDLSSTFDTPSGQPSVFTIIQAGKVLLTMTAQTADLEVTIVDAVQAKQFYPLQTELPDTFLSFSLTSLTKDFVPLSGVDYSVVATNQDNPILDFNVTSVIFSIDNVSSPKTCDLVVNISVDSTTDEDLNSALLIDSLLKGNTTPVTYSGPFGITGAGSVDIVELNAFDADSDPLVYTIEALPAYGTLHDATDITQSTPLTAGTALTNEFVYYKHDGSANYSDSFDFKVNDGFVDSNTSTISVVVTP